MDKPDKPELRRTINDEVEALFVQQYDDPAFREKIEADDAVTLLRKAAPAGSRISQVDDKVLRHALKIVLRRYNISGEDRRSDEAS